MENTTRLKHAIDLNQFRSPENQGVMFELDEKEYEDEKCMDNTYFNKEEVFENVYPADDESDQTDDDDDIMPFKRMSKKMTDISGDGGVLKKILQQGTGNVVPPGALVRTHFNGFLEFADEPYDSSRLRNEVLKFRLGDGEVIIGWDIGVATMKQGELARFLIKPEYGFGEMGCPPRIPENATILYEIELLSFVDKAGSDDYSCLTEEKKRKIPFDEMKKVYLAKKEEGNHLFAANQTASALHKYKKALDILEGYSMKNGAEQCEQQKLLLKLFLNMTLCFLKTGQPRKAITYSKRALEIQRNNPKALYLCGKALHNLSDFERAKSYLVRAHRAKPQSQDINKEMEELEKDMKKFKMIEKDMYSKMLSQPTGETVKERETVKRIIDRSEEASMRCTQEFRELVIEKLQAFKDDPSIIELPFPTINMTVGEINCILENAYELGLDAHQKGTGSNINLKIVKKAPGDIDAGVGV